MGIKDVLCKAGDLTYRFFEHAKNDFEKKVERYEAKYEQEERRAREMTDYELEYQYKNGDRMQKKIAYYELSSRGKAPQREIQH